MVVAAEDIPPGTTIKAEMVTLATDWPDSRQIAGVFTDPQDVVDLVTNYAIGENEPITQSKTGTPLNGSKEGLGVIVPPGMRAVGVQVEEVTAVGGNLLPGDRVDVMAVFETGGQEPTKIGRVVLQNVEVLAVAQERQEPLPAGQDANRDGVPDAATSGHISEDAKAQPGATTLTLAVPLADSLKLALVQEDALNVYVTLRPAGDQDIADVGPIDVATVR
jgi:Flp pilus assembly protein CpaB